MCVLITCEAGGEQVPDWLVANADCEPWKADAGERLPPVDESVKPVGGRFSAAKVRRITSLADLPGREAAINMARQLDANLILNEHAHELIDVTRAPGQRRLFSSLTRALPKRERDRLVSQIHGPYRDRVRAAVAAMRSIEGFVIHLSIRSFDLRRRGTIFRTDVGLLYDPARPAEADLCLDWIDQMWNRVQMLKVRRNYPRRGCSNGLMQTLRAEYSEQEYFGLEVWLNRAWAQRKVALREVALNGICESLKEVLEGAGDFGEDECDSQIQAA